MKILDELIEKSNTNIQTILEFMLKPKDKLEEMFESKWNEIETREYNIIKNDWIKGIQSLFELMKEFFKN